MKRALISDIHANLEALRAVLADIQEQKISQIYCLGDIIGYGPNPRECLDQVMKLPIVILGNHDQAALIDPEGFNPVALQAVYWTRDQLERGGSPSIINQRWDFLGELPPSYRDGELLYVHGSPREPTNEYVFPEDVYNHRKLDSLFERIEKYCFQGHTHIPGIFTEDRRFISPEECSYRYPLGDEKLMVNVGSVGQPRDGNPNACYVVLDDGRSGGGGGGGSGGSPESGPRGEKSVTFRRVQYPKETTRDKIYAVAELDNMLGDRLMSGR